MTVRVRGIYATALTELLADDHDVVQASPAIRERFDREFPVDAADASVETTDDRQGVGVAGEPQAAEAVRERLRAVGRDALAWPNPAPRGAVFRGEVSETLGAGAIVDLGSADGRDVEGFLPYDRVEDYVDEGDSYRLQVAGPAPPWGDARPSMATDLRVPGGLVELRRGSAPATGSSSASRAVSSVAGAEPRRSSTSPPGTRRSVANDGRASPQGGAGPATWSR